jgi:ubiquinone/menaquinone biosynthesis C-methylase UbiE
VHLRSLLQPEETRLLDLGGGTGVTTAIFGKEARDIVVLEPNERKISRGRSAGAPMTFVSGVGESIPYPDGQFDRVVSLLSFHHFSRGDDVLRETARVLAPGGRLVVYDLNPSSLSARWLGLFLGHHRERFASSSDLARRVLAAGFRAARTEPFRSGTFVVADR